MKLADALTGIAPVVGLTSWIGAPSSVDVGGPRTPTAEEAAAKLAALDQQIRDCRSDAVYWGLAGQQSYWRAVCDLYAAAALVGEDALADITLPRGGGVVMDSMAELERFGRDILAEAQARVA